jgi:hypothetical protein
VDRRDGAARRCVFSTAVKQVWRGFGGSYEPSRSVGVSTDRTGPMRQVAADSNEADDPDPSDTGNVLVTSETEGAEISPDGHFLGQTPSTIKLTKGNHRIEVRAPGQEPWVRSLYVLKGNRVTLYAIFAKPDSDDGAVAGDQTKDAH